MSGAPSSLTQFFGEQLSPWLAQQRWYAGKGRVPVLTRIGSLRLEDPAGEVGIHIHLVRDDSGTTPTTYQIPLTSRGTRLNGADHALVGTVQHGRHGTDVNPGSHAGPDSPASHGGESSTREDDTRYIYDAPHDPAFVAAVLRLILDEQQVGAARGHRLTAADPGKLLTSRVLVGEQSNTSVILELADTLGAPAKPLICKLFRVLHDGENPDVVVQSALSATGSSRVPDSVGYVSGRWPDPGAPNGQATGHLAFAQQFLPGVEDAWRVARHAVTSGEEFTKQAHGLGEALADVHATLAQTMGTREPTREDVAALTRSMQSRHAAALCEVPALAEYDEVVVASVQALSSARWPALQRIHGDFHLGQVLDVPGRGWVLVDFEGEPLRPLADRSQPDLALRDVAGMLRSFDFVAGSWDQEHPGRSAQLWADRARTAFLEGYASTSGRDPREDASLLDALELDKALYEVVYEARNRPTWLDIPVTAIARICAARRSDLRP